jgi:hypothetical protein
MGWLHGTGWLDGPVLAMVPVLVRVAGKGVDRESDVRSLLAGWRAGWGLRVSVSVPCLWVIATSQERSPCQR